MDVESALCGVQGNIPINLFTRRPGIRTRLSTRPKGINLKPEDTCSYYVGAVSSPGSSDPERSWWGWANGFSAYVNWYQTDQHNVIGYLTAQNVVDLGSSAPAGITSFEMPAARLRTFTRTT